MKYKEKLKDEVSLVERQIKSQWLTCEINPELYVRSHIVKALHVAGNFPLYLIPRTVEALDIQISTKYAHLIDIENDEGDALIDLAYVFTNTAILNHAWMQAQTLMDCFDFDEGPQLDYEERNAAFLSSLKNYKLILR